MNESSKDLVCNFHPGVPIFHEGLKYWTCCTKRTSDFQAFLNQVGCKEGSHLWQDDRVNYFNVQLFNPLTVTDISRNLDNIMIFDAKR